MFPKVLQSPLPGKDPADLHRGIGNRPEHPADEAAQLFVQLPTQIRRLIGKRRQNLMVCFLVVQPLVPGAGLYLDENFDHTNLPDS